MEIFKLKTLQNSKFQRSIYGVVLACWTYLTFGVNGIEKMSATSSIGIPYGYIAYPIELLLLLQLIWNTRLAWLLLLILYMALVVSFLVAIFFEIKEYHDELAFSFYVLLTLIIAGAACGMLLLYSIKPRSAPSS